MAITQFVAVMLIYINDGKQQSHSTRDMPRKRTAKGSWQSMTLYTDVDVHFVPSIYIPSDNEMCNYIRHVSYGPLVGGFNRGDHFLRRGT